MPLPENEVFPLIGEAGFEHLVAAFYRQIPTDDLLGPLYPPSDFAGAEQRLRDFLIYRFGGPDRYLHERGSPHLRMRHAPFAIPQAARDRWMLLMNNALEETQLPPEPAATLRNFFEDAATFLINRRG